LISIILAVIHFVEELISNAAGPGTFQHLGGVYAFGADGASQSIVVSNCTFLDVSGGGVKLGKSGERGAPAPAVNTSVKEQDRGFLVQDSLFRGIPAEYSGANPIFAAYVADTTLAHVSRIHLRSSANMSF
jgi:hypothetical protein